MDLFELAVFCSPQLSEYCHYAVISISQSVFTYYLTVISLVGDTSKSPEPLCSHSRDPPIDHRDIVVS